MAGEARPSPGYYVAFALLVVGLVAGASLFLLLATRHQSTEAKVEIDSQPTTCPVGEHAPACYTVMLTNVGRGPAYLTCQLTPAPGTEATFEGRQDVMPVNLLAGQTRQLLVRVVTGTSDSVGQPQISCPDSSS